MFLYLQHSQTSFREDISFCHVKLGAQFQNEKSKLLMKAGWTLWENMVFAHCTLIGGIIHKEGHSEGQDKELIPAICEAAP